MRFRGWFELSSCSFLFQLSLGKENLPAIVSVSEMSRVERLHEEIGGLMDVRAEETQTITTVNV